MPKSKITIHKWNGDDVYSWAVFRDGVLVAGICGLSRDEARYWKRKLEEEMVEKQK